MRKLTITIILLTMLSCRKDSQCWYCEFGQTVNGATKSPQTICNKTEAELLKMQFLDAQGAEFSMSCKPK